MSALGLLAAALLLIPAGIFGACLPIVRELGRPTRAASAMLCGALALTTEALILSLVGIEWTLPSLLIPLVAVSALAGWMLCRLPESPGPETAYPGFPPALIVLVASAHLVVMLVASSATAGGLASFLGVEAVADYPRPFPVTKELGGMVLGGTGWGGDPGSSVLWLLAGLPIVAALLAMNMPLRKAWMLAAIWYAAMAMSLALTYSGESAEAPLLVFETLGAIAVYNCAKEPRLLPFAALMLFGAATTRVEALVAIAAIVSGGFLRDFGEGARPATRRAAILLSGPAVAVALRFGYQLASGANVGQRPHGELARLQWDHVTTLLGAFPENLAAGTFGLSWLIPLAIIVAVLPVQRRRIAALLPLLVPVAALALFFAFDYLRGSGNLAGQIGWTLHRSSQPALSMLILVAGLVYRDAARPAQQRESRLRTR